MRSSETMERDPLSDEEDDRENLIDQNDRKHDNHNHHESSFHIDDHLDSSLRRRFRFFSFSRNRRYYYLFAIFLPLFIVLLYFSTSFRNLFSAPNLALLKFDSLSDRMRESELRALYLLRQQQLSLYSIWNRSFVNSSAFNSSSNVDPKLPTNSGILLEDLKSALLKQFSLNKEIQQVLLSTHKSGNRSSESDNKGLFLDSTCKKVDQRFSERSTIQWKPRSNKFLFAICLSGQMSNHLICLEKHMFFAALLNRVLVIPSSRFDYQYHRVLDIAHINECLGTKVVITFEEFVELKKSHPHIDKFICYFLKPNPCYLDEEHLKRLKSLGLSMGKLESPWNEDTKKPSKRSIEDIEAKFKSDDDVIAIGDVFYADLEKDWLTQPGGPLAHKCKTLIEPSRVIMVTAQRFIQTFLGENFVALHFRRHGFLTFCNAKKPSCFYPIPQAADCISRVVGRANAPVIYLSTDAAESETGLLQSLVAVNGKTVPLVKRPSYNSAEKWDAFLHRHGLQDDPQVEAMLDKTICAMSSVFIGSLGSTFTEDILRLRKDWQSASLCDEYLCHNELPNFIAENE
ncbi:hypothetical protein K2173_024345 [Erythroxylum novogranatense]|uniref:GDP-fucose protein O-fucosyltransferase 2 n=1 Tax=Erythroxylum novogranatense TaxID=1862640 RepID=A0AAV8SU50_9ROSI|nr:hypothetical protein K2173_024345 [Erythroxylum novogranatense]